MILECVDAMKPCRGPVTEDAVRTYRQRRCLGSIDQSVRENCGLVHALQDADNLSVADEFSEARSGDASALCLVPGEWRSRYCDGYLH